MRSLRPGVSLATKTDVLHLVFAMLPIPALFRAVALGALTAGAVFLAGRVGRPLWPSQWPIALQLVLALAVAELGQYWVHRLSHERTALWRLHSVHHSVERLYWLNAGRFHPLDTLLQHAAEIAPLVLLGANEHVLADGPPVLGLNVTNFPRTFFAQLAAPFRFRW